METIKKRFEYWGNIKILVANHDPIVRIAIATKISQVSNATVFQAENGKIVLQMVNEMPLDVIIIPVFMHFATAFEVLNDMNEKGFQQEVLKIIITLDKSPETAEDLWEMKVDEIFYMPGIMDELMLRMDKLLIMRNSKIIST